MKPSNTTCALLVCALLLGATPSHAQQFDEERALLDGYSSVPIVGQVISAVQDAIEELIAEALDRFDASLLLAAMEARATVNQVETQFDDALERTIEELDGQQRRIISDITSLATRLTQTTSSDVSSLVNSIRQDIRLLEPISKSFKQYQQGCELHKAQEVVRIVLPARHNTALPLEPGKKALDLPPPRVAT